MNLQQIRNPHLIYPGQVLVLKRLGDRAVLELAGDPPVVKLTPRVRSEALDDGSIPPLPRGAIEPFLTEVTVVDAERLERAPRIVAAPEARVLLARGDRAYARGQWGAGDELSGDALRMPNPGQVRRYAIYRNAVPLRDPETGDILGLETVAVGRADLVRNERTEVGADGNTTVVPATVDIVSAREEVRIGDRLLPVPTADTQRYVPHAPAERVRGQIVKIHGDAVRYAGQNQVVVLNRGREHGLEPGHVLALLRDRMRVTDKTDEAKPTVTLPGERNGLMMVFRVFDRVSYALVLQIVDGVKAGDAFVTP